MIPPDGCEAARRDAPIHLQLAIDPPPAPPAGFARLVRLSLTGTIVRVLRDASGALRPGARLTIDAAFHYLDPVQKLRPGEDPLEPPLAALSSARIIEVYLAPDTGGALVVPEGQLTLLAAPTDRPANPADAPGWGVHRGPDLG